MIKRKLFEELKAHLTKKELSLLVGPRQCGKTTLMQLLKTHLETLGSKCVFLNLDIEADMQYFVSQKELLKKIQLEIGQSRGYVFIDEIQRKENAGLFLKGIYDMNLSYKFVVSGSGSIELKSKIHESMAGRKRIFELNTLTFDEFINFKTGYKYQNKLMEFFSIEKETALGLFEEYIAFGGYPRIVLEETRDEKRKVMEELYQSYLERDIIHLLGVQKSQNLTALVKIMASQAGRLTNISELSATLGLAMPTVKNYLWYLEKTFILRKVTPFHRNIRKELIKSPVFYFHDLGLKNYAAGGFDAASGQMNAGFAFQNAVFNLLKEKTRDSTHSVHFWRTKDKAEVDFVIDTGTEIVPIEAKYAPLKIPRVKRSFRSFLTAYRPKHAFIVHTGSHFNENINGTKVSFVPFYDLPDL